MSSFGTCLVVCKKALNKSSSRNLHLAENVCCSRAADGAASVTEAVDALREDQRVAVIESEFFQRLEHCAAH